MVKPLTRLGYTLGINRDTRPYEAPLQTGGEKFFQGRAERQRVSPGLRKAGERLDMDLRQVFASGFYAPASKEDSGGSSENRQFFTPRTRLKKI